MKLGGLSAPTQDVSGMLDDLIIFGLAAFAIQKIINSRYAVLSRLAGGVVLIGLGVWMLAR